MVTLLENSLIQYAPVSLAPSPVSSSEAGSSTREGQKQVSTTVWWFSIRVQLKVMSIAGCFLLSRDNSRSLHCWPALRTGKTAEERRQMSSCLLVTSILRPLTVVYVCPWQLSISVMVSEKWLWFSALFTSGVKKNPKRNEEDQLRNRLQWTNAGLILCLNWLILVAAHPLHIHLFFYSHNH